MDPALVDLARMYRRQGRRRSREDAEDELLDLYEYYTGDELDIGEMKPGRWDRVMASTAGRAARGAASVLRLGLFKYPVGLLAREGTRRSRETMKLINKVREDRKLLEPLARPRKPRWRL